MERQVNAEALMVVIYATSVHLFYAIDINTYKSIKYYDIDSTKIHNLEIKKQFLLKMLLQI